MSPRGITSWSRETRLLLLTIAVSLAALIVLARFRFPGEQRIEAPPPQPLERLAARATYDELAAIIQRSEQRIAPSLVMLRTTTAMPGEPRSLESLLTAQPSEPELDSSFLVGLRIRPDVALVRKPPGARVESIVGDPDGVPLVIAEDPLRQIALIRVPPAPDGMDWQWRPIDALTVPRYVIGVEGSRGGATPRPVFLGRADRIDDPRWGAAHIVLARTPVTAEGSLVFSLDGELIGLVTPTFGMLTIVPARALVAAAERLLETGSPVLTDFGVTLTPLTGDIVKSLGATSGVIVHSVGRGTRADGHLRAGDLIQSINGRPAVSPDTVLLQLAQIPAGQPARVVVLREKDTVTIEIP